jgi:predicted nuclease with TOPRIM domain
VKLSEQIADTCCGVLAEKEEMVDRAKTLEAKVEELEEKIEELARYYNG